MKHEIPTFDTRCIVHTGQYFDTNKASEKCLGRMNLMKDFWVTGLRDACICDKHIDDWVKMGVDRSYLTSKIEEAVHE